MTAIGLVLLFLALSGLGAVILARLALERRQSAARLDGVLELRGALSAALRGEQRRHNARVSRALARR